MTEPGPPEEDRPRKAQVGGDGTGIALGLSFGLLAGLVFFDNLALGLGLGLVAGVTYDAVVRRNG